MSNSQFRLKKINLFIILLLLTASCANPVAPTGGPKDEKPPTILKTVPLNQSTNFTGNEISIYFDEYINLKDISTQLIISPPLKEAPEFKVKGKRLVTHFKEPLREETTYNIFFGDAIVDITEGNPLSGYKFTFSTGSVLDSMIITGKLINAFNLTPVKGAYVMLYDSVYDSIPYKQIPYYISRTRDNGDFELTNLRDMEYLIFALTDLNSNYLFDQSNEEIAFLDTLINPWHLDKKLTSGQQAYLISNVKIQGNDSIINDSLSGKLFESIGETVDSVARKSNEESKRDYLNEPQAVDSVVIAIIGNDSIAIIDTISHVTGATGKITDSLIVADLGRKAIQLFHFKEVDSTQRLLKTQLLRDNVLSFQFKVPVKEPSFEFIEHADTKILIANNTAGDTLTMWLPGYESDSIKLKVSDGVKVLDTLEMSIKVRKNIRKKEQDQTPTLKINNNITGGRIKPTSPFKMIFTDPIATYNLTGISLKEDSIYIDNPMMHFADSIKRQLEIKYPWKPDVHYTVIIQDSSVVSVLGAKNDSLAFSFMSMKEEETARLSLTIDLPENTPYIIQLLDTKEKVLQQYMISEDLTLTIPYITPGKYKIKAIDDRNGNGYWDTGKYLQHRYPERVIYYPKELELRANWTLDEAWTIPASGE